MRENRQEAIRAAFISIVANLALAIIKFVAGVLGNSYALVADAIESTTDVFSSALVVFGLKYSTKPADDNHPYGHGRAEPLITFLVVGFLVVSACVIAYNSVIQIQTPHKLPKEFTIYVLVGIVAYKEFMYRYMVRKGKTINSSALVADAWHHRSDAITSLTALIGISIALILGPGYESADDWAALIASFIIVYNAYKIFRPALGEILDEQTYDEMVEKIRKICIMIEGVKNTEKCYIRKTGLTYHVDLHVRVPGDISVVKGHDIAHKVKDELREHFPEIADVHVHIEPVRTNS